MNDPGHIQKNAKIAANLVIHAIQKNYFFIRSKKQTENYKYGRNKRPIKSLYFPRYLQLND